MSDFQRFLDKKLSSIDFQERPTVGNPVNEYDIYAEIRESISALRKQRKLTQKELAEKTGLTQANICNLERGTTKPTIETLKKIADATGTRLVISFDE